MNSPLALQASCCICQCSSRFNPCTIPSPTSATLEEYPHRQAGPKASRAAQTSLAHIGKAERAQRNDSVVLSNAPACLRAQTGQVLRSSDPTRGPGVAASAPVSRAGRSAALPNPARQSAAWQALCARVDVGRASHAAPMTAAATPGLVPRVVPQTPWRARVSCLLDGDRGCYQ